MHLNSQTSIRTNTNTLKVAQNNLTHPNLQKKTSKLTLKHDNIRTHTETSELTQKHQNSHQARIELWGDMPPL